MPPLLFIHLVHLRFRWNRSDPIVRNLFMHSRRINYFNLSQKKETQQQSTVLYLLQSSVALTSKNLYSLSAANQHSIKDYALNSLIRDLQSNNYTISLKVLSLIIITLAQYHYQYYQHLILLRIQEISNILINIINTSYYYKYYPFLSSNMFLPAPRSNARTNPRAVIYLTRKDRWTMIHEAESERAILEATNSWNKRGGQKAGSTDGKRQRTTTPGDTGRKWRHGKVTRLA